MCSWRADVFERRHHRAVICCNKQCGFQRSTTKFNVEDIDFLGENWEVNFFCQKPVNNYTSGTNSLLPILFMADGRADGRTLTVVQTTSSHYSVQLR